MSETASAVPYRVLARKYRPRHFGELIGQEALVRTLSNAIASGRIHHAYMLTGVRGVGKTTTARIIARALNYTGPDGKAGPTTGPTDDCETCRAIAEDRHPDVMEMDAASRTGVDDIREILDGVRYAPASARYKVYIIDEVHMLSRNAFNALLKTLEEPPPHVIFIFATTEIRKVPVTVLSRCQRFDLRRVDAATLAAYYKTICDRENVRAEDEALALIGRAADGSVRDGLSLLDQAIALSGGAVTAEGMRDMLGLADRGRVLDMLEHAINGECGPAVEIAADLDRNGADAGQLAEDMLEYVHLMTRLKAAPGAGGLHAIAAQDTIDRAAALAARLSMPTLGRAWQLLLKAAGEIQQAPDPRAALEMALIRLAYAADLPDPADLLKKMKSGDMAAFAPERPAAPQAVASPPMPAGTARLAAGGGAVHAIAETAPAAAPDPRGVQDIVAMLEDAREAILASQVRAYLHLVKMEPGRLEIRLEPEAHTSLAQDLRKFLIGRTGKQWFVSISGAQGQPTLAEAAAAERRALEAQAMDHPAVRRVLELFPGAKLKTIRKD